MADFMAAVGENAGEAEAHEPDKCKGNDEPKKWSTDRIAYVVGLLTSQDQITWLVVSVFVAAQSVLIVGYVQNLTAAPAFLGIVALSGLAMNTASFAATSRSNNYMDGYMQVLRQTCRREFRLTIPGPSATIVITALHVVLYVFWGVLLGARLL